MSATIAWPIELQSVFENFITTEFAALTRAGHPITSPLIPFVSDDRTTLDVSTGLTYPTKAERARRNPKVCLLYSDPIGASVQSPPTVLVYGAAAVRDSDLQANADRYLRESLRRFPEVYSRIPGPLLRRMDWYFARIWIQVMPLRILWWPAGQTDCAPNVWTAPGNLTPPVSDPAPPGKPPPAWRSNPTDWRAGARHAVEALGVPILTVIDSYGYPVPFRTCGVSIIEDGFCVELPAGAPAPVQGAACLTFHTHPAVFTRQENKAFVGIVHNDAGELHFIVERQIADWSLSGSRLSAVLNLLLPARTLGRRLAHESARRGQPVPRVRKPNHHGF